MTGGSVSDPGVAVVVVVAPEADRAGRIAGALEAAGARVAVYVPGAGQDGQDGSDGDADVNAVAELVTELVAELRPAARKPKR